MGSEMSSGEISELRTLNRGFRDPDSNTLPMVIDMPSSEMSGDVLDPVRPNLFGITNTMNTRRRWADIFDVVGQSDFAEPESEPDPETSRDTPITWPFE